MRSWLFALAFPLVALLNLNTGCSEETSFDCPGYCGDLYQDAELVTACETECAAAAPHLKASFLDALTGCTAHLPCEDSSCEFFSCYRAAVATCSGTGQSTYIEALCRENARCFDPDALDDLTECTEGLAEANLYDEVSCFSDSAVQRYVTCSERACLPGDDPSVNALDDQCVNEALGLYELGNDSLFFIYIQ